MVREWIILNVLISSDVASVLAFQRKTSDVF